MASRLNNIEPGLMRALAPIHLELKMLEAETREQRKRRYSSRKRSPIKRYTDEIAFHPKPKYWDSRHMERVPDSRSVGELVLKSMRWQSSPERSRNEKRKQFRRSRSEPLLLTGGSSDVWKSNMVRTPETSLKTANVESSVKSEKRQVQTSVSDAATPPVMPVPRRLEVHLGCSLASHSTPPSEVRQRRKAKLSSKPRASSGLPQKAGDPLSCLWNENSDQNTGSSNRTIGVDAEETKSKKVEIEGIDKLKNPWGTLAEISGAPNPPMRSKSEPRISHQRVPLSLSKSVNGAVRYIECKQPPIRRGDGTFVRPAGRPPKGTTWDKTTGVWLLDSAGDQRGVPMPGKPVVRPRKGTKGESARTWHLERTIAQRRDGVSSEPKDKPKKGTIWDETAGTWHTQRTIDQPADFTSIKPRSKNKKGTKLDESAGTRHLEGKRDHPAYLPFTKPRGRPPKGTVWDEIAGAWRPKGALDQREDGTFLKPSSKAPKGTIWDETTGAWRLERTAEGRSVDAKMFATGFRKKMQHDKISEDGRVDDSSARAGFERGEHSMEEQQGFRKKQVVGAKRRMKLTSSNGKPRTFNTVRQSLESLAASGKRMKTSTTDAPHGRDKMQNTLDRGDSLQGRAPTNRTTKSTRKRKNDSSSSSLQQRTKYPREREYLDSEASLQSLARRISPNVFGTPRSHRSTSSSRSTINVSRARDSVSVKHGMPRRRFASNRDESADFVACGDCLNCRLPLNCGSCLMCKNSLHFGSLFPACVRRICVSPVLPPMQRVAVSRDHSGFSRQIHSPLLSTRKEAKAKIGERDEASERGASKASFQTDDMTDTVESLERESDGELSDL